VPFLCEPVNVYEIVEDLFCSVLSALLGRVNVNRRWSVAPAVKVRFESAMLVPITAREASTVDVVPLQV